MIIYWCTAKMNGSFFYGRGLFMDSIANKFVAGYDL
jgi:hypothetical protein